MALSRDLVTRFLGEDSSLQGALRRTATGTEGLNAKMDKFARGARTAFVATAAVSLARMGQELFDAGIQAEAMGRRFDTVFGSAGTGISARVDELAASLGIASVRAEGMAADVGKILTPMGLSQQAAADASVEVLRLADVWDQFTGGEIGGAEITDKLTRGILGQTRGLVDLGIKFSEADVQARLAADGLDGLTGGALKAAEAQTRLTLITEASADALSAYADGETDAEKAADDLSAALDEAKLALGEAFTALAPLVGGLANMIGLLGQIPGGTATAVGALAGLKLGAGAAATSLSRVAAGGKATMLGMAGMSGPVGLAVGALIAFGIATDPLPAKIAALRAESERLAPIWDAQIRSLLEQTGWIHSNADAVAAAAIRYRELGDSLDEIPSAVQRLEAELAAIDFDTTAERAAEAAGQMVSIWAEVPDRVREINIGQAIQDALHFRSEQISFADDMQTLIDNGYQALVEEIKTNPDREEAIALMDYFASDLAAAADFSTQIGAEVQKAFAVMKSQVSAATQDGDLKAAWNKVGKEMAQEVATGFSSVDIGAQLTADLLEAMRRIRQRTGDLGI